MKNKRLVIDKKQKMKTAYHEAGHATMIWMFGNMSNMIHIDMRGDWGFHAVVRWNAINLQKISLPRPLLRYEAKKWTMVDLAGYAVEMRLKKRDYMPWLKMHIAARDTVDFDFDNDEDWDFSILAWDKPSDLHAAFERAKIAYGDNGHAKQMMLRMAAWTEEAFASPRVWAVVKTLAEQLAKTKTKMTPNCANKIMNKAWGSEEYFPYMELGPKWRRRFTVDVRNYIKET